MIRAAAGYRDVDLEANIFSGRKPGDSTINTQAVCLCDIHETKPRTSHKTEPNFPNSFV
jgi:hypothetical protein